MGTRIAVMYQGKLQQVDTPQTLYDHPINMFVAGFIGSFSPAMNFLEARLDYEHGEMVVHIAGLGRLVVPPARKPTLDPYVGKPIVLGIRPEHMHDAHFLPSGIDYPAPLHAKVGLVERMGSEVYVYFEEAGHRFVGRFDARTGVQPGESVTVVLAMEKMHVFDWHTQQTLGE
jgi:multiple sugar transport system ATP-binding protein